MKLCILCNSKSFKRLFQVENFHLEKCLRCALVRTSGESNVVTYKNYHRDEDYKEFESQFKNIFQKRFKLISRYIQKGRVLDIGASTGIMLDLFKEGGWDTWGVEPSKSALAVAKKGHKIFRGFFEKVNFPRNFFDLVILNHTLEHMVDPLAVLVKARSLLKKDGIILVDVPNSGGLGSKILGKHWPYLLPREHKHQFTETVLSIFFKKAGFKVVHTESRSGIFEYANPIAELWESLITFKKRFFTDLITLPYAFCTTLLDMGDSMTMVGEKGRISSE